VRRLTIWTAVLHSGDGADTILCALSSRLLCARSIDRCRKAKQVRYRREHKIVVLNVHVLNLPVQYLPVDSGRSAENGP
jgi:hypothetical protein